MISRRNHLLLNYVIFFQPSKCYVLAGLITSCDSPCTRMSLTCAQECRRVQEAGTQSVNPQKFVGDFAATSAATPALQLPRPRAGPCAHREAVIQTSAKLRRSHLNSVAVGEGRGGKGATIDPCRGGERGGQGGGYCRDTCCDCLQLLNQSHSSAGLIHGPTKLSASPQPSCRQPDRRRAANFAETCGCSNPFLILVSAK